MFYQDLDFSNKLEQSARNIYSQIWPFSTYSRLTAVGGAPHVFDLKYGIDSIITLDSGESIPIQEKFRRNSALPYQDLLLEFENGDGSKGEYFHLFAHYLVQAIASEDEQSIVFYRVYNVPSLIRAISENGGLKRCGTRIQNREHGKAVAYAVPFHLIESALVWSGAPFSMSADITGEIGDEWHVLI